MLVARRLRNLNLHTFCHTVTRSRCLGFRSTLILTASLLSGPSLMLGPAAFAAPSPSVKDFFKLSTFTSPRLSPSGKYIALIVRRDDVEFVVVRETMGVKLIPIAKFPESKFRPNRLLWASDDRLLISGIYRSEYSIGVRARATQLYAVDRDGKNLKYLAKKWPNSERIQFQDNIIHMLPDDPKHILLQLRKPGDRLPGAYRLNVYSGKLKRIQRKKANIIKWFADEAGDVRLGYGVNPPNYEVIARKSTKTKFETIAQFSPTKGEGMSVLGFTSDPNTILVSAHRKHASDPEGDRNAIFKFSLETNSFGDLVVDHDLVDVNGPLVFLPGTQVPVAVQYIVEGRELHFLDKRYKALQGGLDIALPDRTNVIVDTTKDGRILLVRSSAPKVPPEIYILFRDHGQATFLFAEYPELQGVPLGDPRPISYLARDGLKIHGYLTLPPGSSGKNLPAILLPHGGPWGRDFLAFRPDVAFLVNRGYAVLQMNFRGSTGYGNAHQARGYKRFGLEMQDDITDGAAWLVKQGVADARRIGIFGASYGGYAALMAAVKTPDMFRCAAGYAGVYNLLAEVKHDSFYIGGKMQKEYMGSDSKLLKAASPIFGIDHIRIPILLGHGEDDSNVNVNQSKKMAKALRKAGKQVELALYKDEVHGHDVGGTATDFYERLEKFFAVHLAPLP